MEAGRARAQDDGVGHATRAFVGSWTWLARALPSGLHAERDGMVVAATGLPDPTLNPAFVVREPTAPADAVAWSAARRHEGSSNSTGIDLPDGRYPAVEAALVELGYERRVTRPAMVVHLDDLVVPPTPPDLEVRAVRSHADWAGYVAVQVDTFGFDPDIAAAFPPEALVGRSGMELVVGVVGDTVTSAAAVYITGTHAGVYAVGTRAEHRRRGHGAAVTAAAVRAAGRAGAEVAALQSTADGLGVYRALGFAEVGPWVVWVDPALEP